MIILPMPAAAVPVIAQPVSLSSSVVSSAALTVEQRKHSVKASVSGSQQVINAYQNRQSNIIVENVSGVVEAVLLDDENGSRHQRFIVRVAGGQTVLIVHNIDLAARINGLRTGDLL